MDEIEAIDLMLKDDAERNSGEDRGFVSASKLFDMLGVPAEMRSYVLDAAIELGLFEYNKPRWGIRATYLGRKMYRDGGYKKNLKKEKIADWISYLERFINTLKP